MLKKLSTMAMISIIAVVFVACGNSETAKNAGIQPKMQGAGNVAEGYNMITNDTSEVVGSAESAGDTEQIKNEVSKGIEKIQSVTADAVSEVKAAASEPETAPPVNPTTTPRTVKLDVASETGAGTMHIVSAEIIKHERNISIVFNYLLETQKQPYPGNVTAKDKNGNIMQMLNFGATPKEFERDERNRITKYKYNDTFGVYAEISGTTDLSEIALTYNYESFDPVTVKINIPLQ